MLYYCLFFLENINEDNLFLWKKTKRLNTSDHVIYLTSFEYDMRKVHDELNGHNSDIEETDTLIIRVDENNDIEKRYTDIEKYKRNKSVYRALWKARSVSLEVTMDKLFFRKAMYKKIMKKSHCTTCHKPSILKRKSSY